MAYFPVFLPACATCSELPSNIRTVQCTALCKSAIRTRLALGLARRIHRIVARGVGDIISVLFLEFTHLRKMKSVFIHDWKTFC